jgi:transposase
MATTRGTQRDFAALEARRMEAARLFARKVSQNEVARQVGVDATAAHRWFHAWRAQGRRGLKAAGRAGRKPRLDRAALAKVERALLQGAPAHGFATDLWTLPRVATLIARQTGVQFHPGHVWYLLRALNWSVQRPVRQAQERDEAAIAQWKRTRWVQVKKTPGGAAPGSSSRMKAASRTTRSSAERGRRAASRRS